MSYGSGPKEQDSGYSGQNKFPPQCFRAFLSIEIEKLSHLEGTQSLNPLLLHIESQMRCHLIRMPPGHLTRCYGNIPLGIGPRGKPRTCWRDYGCVQMAIPYPVIRYIL